MDEIVQLSNAVLAAVGAAVMTYGHAVLSKTEEQAADETVRLGRRILTSLRGTGQARPALEGAVHDLVGNPGDDDALAALRMQIRKLLTADPELVRQIKDILGDSAAPGGHNGQISVHENSGIISTGSHAVNKMTGNDR